jgi:hypothetical protein
MGYGSYSLNDRSVRADSMGFYTKSISEVFESKNLNESMNPKNVTLRESRDSKEHPNSIAIILGLDVTGSMGYIPQELIKDGLPTIMANIIEHGNPDPQVMFLAIGDHKVDRAPLQISQFESNDELLDHWLTKTWLEGGGGGNDGESYSLAHYFAAKHTVIDCLEKRNQKGFLFTIGDDKPHTHYSSEILKNLLGDTDIKNSYSDVDLLKLAQEKYHVYHIHVGPQEASNGVKNRWKELLNENCLIVPNYKDVAKTIAETVVANTRTSVKSTWNDDVIVNKVKEETNETDIIL